MKTKRPNIKVLWAVPGLLLAAAGCNQGAQTGGESTATDDQLTRVEPASAEVTEPNQPVRAYVRAVHTVRGAGPVSLAIDGKPIVENLAFGNASDFMGLHGEKVKIHSTNAHQITVVDGENKTLAGPLSVDMERGEDVTIVIGGTKDNLTLTPFEHTNRGPQVDKAKLAVLHAEKALPEVSIAVGNQSWPGDIGYGEVTRYQPLEPGAQTLKVMAGKATLTQPVDLEADKVYSVIAFADAAGKPKLYFMEDKFVPTLVRQEDVGVPTNQ